MNKRIPRKIKKKLRAKAVEAMDKRLCDAFKRKSDAIPAGKTVRDVMEDENMTIAELAKKMRISENHINSIFDGKSPITHILALKLEMIFDVHAVFWMNLEKGYRKDLTKLKLKP